MTCQVVWRKLGDVGEYPPHTTAGASYTASHPAPAQPLRPQSAAGNPYVSSGSSGFPGPQPPAHSMPSSPTTPSGYHDSRGHLRQSAMAPGSPKDASGPSSLGQVPQSGGYAGERRGQLPQGPRSGTGHSGHGQAAQSTALGPGGVGNYGQGAGGMGTCAQGGGGRENFSGHGGGGGGGRENLSGQKGNRALQGQTYSQPVAAPSAHATERPRQLQPPPYSSAKTASTVTPSARPGQNLSQFPPPSHPIPQPHHQPPSSRQSQQPPPRYQQRTHPLQANQGSSQPSQGHPLPRSASTSATYYVSHPTSPPKSHSASALPSHPHPAPASSIPGASYLYSQRGGVGASHPQFRPNQGNAGQGARSGAELGRTEWKQTYLDD